MHFWPSDRDDASVLIQAQRFIEADVALRRIETRNSKFDTGVVGTLLRIMYIMLNNIFRVNC